MTYECKPNALNLFVCEFNHTAISNCVSDSDCAVNGALCYVNASWSALPSQCACHVPYALTGPNCDQLGGPALPVLAITVVYVVAALVALIVSLRAMGNLKLWRFKTANSHHWTVLMLLLGSLFATCAGALQLAQSSGTWSFTVDSSGNKAAAQHLVTEVLFALWFAATSFAALNVSATWLYLAVVSERNNRALARRYRRLLMVYFAAVGMAVIVLVALHKCEYAIMVCLPGVAYVAVVYPYAYLRIHRQSFPGSDNGARLRRILQETGKVLLLLSACATTVLVLMGFGWFAVEDTPALPTSLLLVRLAFLVAEISAVTVAAYALTFSHVDTGKHYRVEVTSKQLRQQQEAPAYIAFPTTTVVAAPKNFHSSEELEEAALPPPPGLPFPEAKY